MESTEIDYTDPAAIMGFIFALICDGAFLFLIGLVIPGVGLAIAMFVIGAHYLFGIVLLAMFIYRMHGWLGKLLFVFSVVLPLPTLTLGLILGIVFSNKFIALLGEQVLILGLTAATAGGAAPLEEGAKTAKNIYRGAKAAGQALEEGAKTAKNIYRGAKAAGQALEEGAKTAKNIYRGAKAAGQAIDRATGGEGGESELSEEEQRRLDQALGEPETPEEEAARKGFQEAPMLRQGLSKEEAAAEFPNPPASGSERLPRAPREKEGGSPRKLEDISRAQEGAPPQPPSKREANQRII